MAARHHRYPIRASDICGLGGAVSVHAGRDRCEGTPIYRVSYISGGGDLSFTSLPIEIEDCAHAAARVLAELVGAKPPPIVARADEVQEVRFATS